MCTNVIEINIKPNNVITLIQIYIYFHKKTNPISTYILNCQPANNWHAPFILLRQPI